MHLYIIEYYSILLICHCEFYRRIPYVNPKAILDPVLVFGVLADLEMILL